MAEAVKKEESFCKVYVNGKSCFQCKLCSRNVSTKANVLKHLFTQHKLSPIKSVKKLYTKDNLVPVPRSTLYRWKKKSEQRKGETSDNMPESLPVIAEIQKYQGGGEDVDHLNDDDHKFMDDSEMNSEKHFEISSLEDTCSFSSDSRLSDSFSSDSSVSDLVLDDHERVESGTNLKPESSDGKSKSLQLLHCFKRHNLTASASKDVLRTLKTFIPETDSETRSLLSYKQLLSYIPACNPKEVYYCIICENVSQSDGNQFNCTEENCRGKLKSFMIADVKELFCNWLKTPGILKDILQTKKEIIESGDTNLIRDIYDGKMYKNFNDQHINTDDIHLSAILNTDGVNLYSSSRVELWPVFMAINELNPKLRFSRENLLLIGLWQGKGKPPFKQFLTHVGHELNLLTRNGVQIEVDSLKYTVYLRVLCITLDLPAKAAALNMTLFNGSEACITCEEPGVVVAQGRGHCRSYPYRTLDELYPIRSHNSVIELMNCATASKRAKGFKGLSGLACLEEFDLVKGTVPDYMHAILLGIVKTLMNKWFSPTESGNDYFIGKKVKTVSERFSKIKPPHFIERLPRDLEKNYSHFKATELQSFLLYYSIPCLHGIHGDRYLQHFALLSEAVFILLGDEITEESLERSKLLLNDFYQQFSDLYGKGSRGLNVHNVCLHMPTYVKNLGPIWSWSCFAFEDGNSKILKSVHGTADVVMQCFKNQDISMYFKSVDGVEIIDPRKMKVTHRAENCDVFGSLQKFSRVPRINSLIVLGIENHEQIRKAQRICVNGERFFSTEYSRMKRRVCHAVNFSDNEMGLIEYFILVIDTNIVYAVVKKMRINNTSWLQTFEAGKHLIPVKITNNNELELILASQLKSTLIFLGLETNADDAVVISVPNRQGHSVFK